MGATRQGAILKLVSTETTCSKSIFRRLLTNILTPVTGMSVTCYLRHSKSAITIYTSVCIHSSLTSMPYLEQQVLVATRKSTWLVTVDFDFSSTSFRSFEASVCAPTYCLDLGQDPLNEVSLINPNVSLFRVQQCNDALSRSLVYHIRVLKMLKRDYWGDWELKNMFLFGDYSVKQMPSRVNAVSMAGEGTINTIDRVGRENVI